jgi:hypothetical protein
MVKIERIGNLYGFTGGSFAGMVYGTGGLAPTVNTSGGGNREPLILVYEENDPHKHDH